MLISAFFEGRRIAGIGSICRCSLFEIRSDSTAAVQNSICGRRKTELFKAGHYVRREEKVFERNAENVIILQNTPVVAQQYAERRQILWDESKSMPQCAKFILLYKTE